jgi:hypothetical protein
MKKRLYYFIPVLLLCFFINSVQAQQNVFIGVKGGISIPNLTAGSGNQNPLSNGYSSRLGADFGVLAEFPINKWFSIQPEIDYSQQGGKHDGLQAFPNPQPPPTYLYANYNSTAKLNYLLVPVMGRFNFHLADKLKLYVNAGVFAGFLLSAKTVASGSSTIYADPAGQEPIGGPEQFDSTQDIKSSVNTFNFGVIGAVGLSYAIGQGKIFVEGGGNYGFINIQKYATDGTNYTGAATIHVGYEYALECKKKQK